MEFLLVKLQGYSELTIDPFRNMYQKPATLKK